MISRALEAVDSKMTRWQTCPGHPTLEALPLTAQDPRLIILMELHMVIEILDNTGFKPSKLTHNGYFMPMIDKLSFNDFTIST